MIVNGCIKFSLLVGAYTFMQACQLQFVSVIEREIIAILICTVIFIFIVSNQVQIFHLKLNKSR